MIRVIYGLPRMGKTTLARRLIADSPRSILIDPFRVPSATHEIWAPEWDTEGIDFENDEFKIGWHCEPDWELFQSLSNVDIVYDDPDGESWRGGQVRNPWLRKILTQYGHYGQTLTIVTQRVKLTPLFVRDLTAEVYVFMVNGADERAEVFRQWGIQAPSAPLQFAAWFQAGHKPPEFVLKTIGRKPSNGGTNSMAGKREPESANRDSRASELRSGPARILRPDTGGRGGSLSDSGGGGANGVGPHSGLPSRGNRGGDAPGGRGTSAAG